MFRRLKRRGIKNAIRMAKLLNQAQVDILRALTNRVLKKESNLNIMGIRELESLI